MDENITEGITGTVPATEEKEPQAPSQEKRTEAEKAAFTLRKTAERVKELGLDPNEILDLNRGESDEDDKPVTLGMLKQIQMQDARKSALQLAEEITDEETRTAVKQALETRVTPSGNPEEDFRFALAAVSAPKNKQVMEMITNYVPPKRVVTGGSMPAHIEEEFTPTEEERYHMTHFGLTKEKVIAARKRDAERRH